jgi:hypothetical protein
LPACGSVGKIQQQNIENQIFWKSWGLLRRDIQKITLRSSTEQKMMVSLCAFSENITVIMIGDDYSSESLHESNNWDSNDIRLFLFLFLLLHSKGLTDDWDCAVCEDVNVNIHVNVNVNVYVSGVSELWVSKKSARSDEPVLFDDLELLECEVNRCRCRYRCRWQYLRDQW